MNPEGAQTSSDAAKSPLQLQQAVASQGILLGQHDQVLRGLVESNQALLTQVSALVERMAELSALNLQPAPAPASAGSSQLNPVSGSAGASQGPPVMREPFVPLRGGPRDLPGLFDASVPSF